ncbi:MAG: PEP-CTERM sorting domain-containing protein [Phycisphaerae bacterium]
MFHLTSIVAVVLLLAGVPSAQGGTYGLAKKGPLTTLDYTGRGGHIGTDIAPSFYLTYQHEVVTDPFDDNDTALFDDLILSPDDDVGSTFAASTDPYSDFDGFVTLLTNGTDDTLRMGTKFRVGSGGSTGEGLASESDWLSEFLAPGAVDLSGYLIDEITLTVDKLTFDIPGSDPNGDGNWTDWNAEITFNIVPEPVTLALLGIGVFTLIRRQHCEHRRAGGSPALRHLTVPPRRSQEL